MELNVKSSKVVDTESENQRYVSIIKKMHAELKSAEERSKRIVDHDKVVNPINPGPF